MVRRMAIPEPTSGLDELNFNTYEELLHRLNANDAWRQVAAAVGIFSHDDIRLFERSISPSQRLLHELSSKLCTVGILRDILSECHLYDALSLIAPPEPLQIIQQPGTDGEEDEFVPNDGQLTLEIVATGIPPPQYLWYRENEELQDQTTSVLVIDNFTEEQEGEYRCLVTQEGNEVIEIFSRYVNVRILPEALCIEEQPCSESCCVGEDVTLTCFCDGYPTPRYQWIHGNSVLEGETSNTLTIKCATLSDKGEYICRISNEFDEIYSERVTVSVYDSQPDDFVSKEKRVIPKVTEKVALLIANDEYKNMRRLWNPVNDVTTLSEILTNLGFKVLSLCNLTVNEMRNAVHKVCEMIPENAYVVFYFAGHGFELQGKYMLPVDAPGTYSYDHSLCENEVVRDVLNKNPTLFLMFLDMCLKLPKVEENPDIYRERAPIYIYKTNRNLIEAYSTTSYLGAYERANEDNGIYMKHLKKFLHEDLPITKILEKVHQSFPSEGEDAADKQMPSYSMNVIANIHYLTHPAIGNKNTEAIFASYNMLQPPMHIRFRHVQNFGVVSFERHRNCFQNVMEIRIKNLHKWAVGCHTPCKELEMELVKEGSEYVLRLFKLQKLKMQFTLNISLCTMDIRTGKPQLVDNCYLELENSPLIVSAQLWYDPPAMEDSQELSEL